MLLVNFDKADLISVEEYQMYIKGYKVKNKQV